MNVEEARRQMLAQQLRTWDVIDPDVLSAFETTHREHFVPAAYSRLAFADTEIPLAHHQCMLRPSVEGRLVQALGLEPDDEALQIGAGTGFVIACMGRLCRHVQSLEYFEDLAEGAVRNLCHAGIANVTVEHRDATTLSAPGRYDAILVTAAIPDRGGEARFREALRIGGRLVLVAGRAPLMEACLIRRTSALEWTRTPLFETSLPELIDATARPPFEF